MNAKLRGSILLIAGCSMGAGMLGLPVVTGSVGFIPATLLFILIWAFMALSGLVLAELVLSYKETGVNLLGLAKDSLGTVGMTVTSLTFMFLFYAIMTACILATSLLIHEFFGLSQTVAACIVVLLIYLVITKGLCHVDGWNQLLMVGLIFCYVALIAAGIAGVETSRLLRADFSASLICLPILVVSFGYHNLVPTLASYLNQSRKELKRAIVIGSLIPLMVYLLWEFVILGIVPIDNLAIWKEAQKGGEMITQVLATQIGSSMIVKIAQGFAFFAIATSFLPIAFSFMDFLKDGFLKGRRQPLIGLCVLLPPFVASLVNPHLFLDALDFAGGVCAVILFGILPSIMVYRRQKKIGKGSFVVAKPLVLLFLLVGSCGILVIELLHVGGVLS